MSAKLSDFQSAVQLVSGANLAVFALPGLGQDEVEMEEKRWAALLTKLQPLVGARWQPSQKEKWLRGREAHAKFVLDRQDNDAKRLSVRKFSLAVSVLSAAYLVWMSAFSQNDVDYFCGIVLVSGAIPALALVHRHSEMIICLKRSRQVRTALSSPVTSQAPL